MKPALAGAALAALCALSLSAAPVRADDLTFDNTNFGTGAADAAPYAPYAGSPTYVVSGQIRQVDSRRDRLVVIGDNGRRYNVDDYNAEVRLRGANRAGETIDLAEGMRVLVTGTLLGRTLLEADQVRVLPPAADGGGDPAPRTVALAPVLPLTPSDRLVPLTPVPAAPAIDGKSVALDAVITGVDAAAGRVSLLGPDDRRLTADAHGTDIILRDADRDGQLLDLARGMRVHLIGTQGADGTVQADRIRVLPVAAAPAAQPAVDVTPEAAPPALGDLSQYTGILIDARALPTIERSPAPTIVGPDAGLLYPDRAHVPTPDEVQDESIVRYYRTLEDAEAGVAGPHPLVLTGVGVVGELDGVQLTAEDAALFQALDKRLRYSRTWKVGFLIPVNR